MLYSIGKFAKEIGVTTKTLRSWHESGKLIPCKISESGYKKEIVDDKNAKNL